MEYFSFPMSVLIIGFVDKCHLDYNKRGKPGRSIADVLKYKVVTIMNLKIIYLHPV